MASFKVLNYVGGRQVEDVKGRAEGVALSFRCEMEFCEYVLFAVEPLMLFNKCRSGLGLSRWKPSSSGMRLPATWITSASRLSMKGRRYGTHAVTTLMASMAWLSIVGIGVLSEVRSLRRKKMSWTTIAAATKSRAEKANSTSVFLIQDTRIVYNIMRYRQTVKHSVPALSVAT